MKRFLPILLTAIFFQAHAEDVSPTINQIGERSPCSTEQVAYFDLKNDGTKPRDYKIEVFKWSQYGLHRTADLAPKQDIVTVYPNNTYPVAIISNIQQTDIQQTYKAQFSYTNEDGKPIKVLAPIFVQPKIAKKVDIQIRRMGKISFVKNNGNATLSVETPTGTLYVLPQSSIDLVVNDENTMEAIQTSAKNFNPDEKLDCSVK